MAEINAHGPLFPDSPRPASTGGPSNAGFAGSAQRAAGISGQRPTYQQADGIEFSRNLSYEMGSGVQMMYGIFPIAPVYGSHPPHGVMPMYGIFPIAPPNHGVTPPPQSVFPIIAPIQGAMPPIHPIAPPPHGLMPMYGIFPVAPPHGTHIPPFCAIPTHGHLPGSAPP